MKVRKRKGSGEKGKEREGKGEKRKHSNSMCSKDKEVILGM